MRAPLARAVVIGGAAAMLFSLGPGTLEAQGLDSLRARLTLPAMPTEAAEAPTPAAITLIFPGVTVASPAALGADRGVVYVGAGYQERTRYTNIEDGAAFAGIGLGDARRYLGVELCVTSYSTVRSGFFHRTGLGVQVHRFLGENTAIAVGAESLVMVNGDESDTDRSIYGVITRVFPLSTDPRDPFSLFVATVGLGDGRFRSEDDVLGGRQSVSVFGALSVQVVRAVAGIADWTGQDLALGVSIAPFSGFPLVITPAFMDVTGAAGDGARFVVAFGFGYRLTGPGGLVQF